MTLLFFLLWWNRFSGLRDANGSLLAARAILEGKLPYRDWYLAAPPLHFLKTCFIVRVFGDHLVVLREFAVFERVALALVVYFWLARLVRASHAVLGTIVSIVVSAGDFADPLVSYNHDTIFWGVASGFCASALMARFDRRGAWVFALLSGISAGCCLSSKQTIGLGITLGIPTVVGAYVWRLSGLRHALRFMALFAVGWTIPIAAVCFWLLHEGVLGIALNSMFFRGPAGKGFGSMLTRVIVANGSLATVLALAASACCLIVFARKMPASQTVRGQGTRLHLVATLAVLAIVAAVPATSSGLVGYTGFPKFTIDWVFLTCGVLASFFAFTWLRHEITGDDAQIWLWSTVSFTVAFMLFLSWPGFEAMVLPGLAFLVAYILDWVSQPLRVATQLFCAFLLFTQTVDKLEAPFMFAWWRDEPVRLATVKPTLPELNGLLLPGETVSLIEDVTAIIRRNTHPGDAIFTFPSMPLFYLLSGRWWPTYSPAHNTDVVDDTLARSEADTLLRKRPAVIVLLDLPERTYYNGDLLWRGGKPAGQRAIASAIQTLARSYELAGTFQTQTTFPVKVYVRSPARK